MRALAMYAVQYLRASTGLQPCSIDQQSMAIAAYAALRDFEIMDTYSDDAISGLTLSARPALRRLLADALAPDRKFQAILIYDVSRWGRFQDIDQGAHLEFLCRRAGVAVHYCAEPFENDGSPEADLIKQIKRAIAAEYSRDLAQRVSLGKRHTSGRGLLAGGGTPFAMLREVVDDKGRAVVVLGRGQIKVASNYRVRLTAGPADAVETLKQIFRLYVVAGLKLPAIAAQLNDARAPALLAVVGMCSVCAASFAMRLTWASTFTAANAMNSVSALNVFRGACGCVSTMPGPRSSHDGCSTRRRRCSADHADLMRTCFRI
jgi:DNA invertase Pin-like site-specific DNA recombinase